MPFWGKTKKIKTLQAELEEKQKLFHEEQRKRITASEELQQAELLNWEKDKQIKNLQFQEYRVRDKMKHEFWKEIHPIFFMQGKSLRTACEEGSVYYSEKKKQWVVVESFCVICDGEIEIKTFTTEFEALRYAAIRKAFHIAPDYYACPKCYQNYLEQSA